MSRKNEPKLRFPEFKKSESWLFVGGSELFEPITNKNHNGDLPILAITQEHGAIPRDQIDYSVIATDKSIQSYKIVEIGDFIISLRSFQGGIEYSNYKGICSPAYIILRKKGDIESNFYRHYFKSPQYIKDLNKNIEGIRDGKMVSYDQFSKILIPLPKEKEQQQIADCLSSLDNLIAAQNNKVDFLKNYKKGLLQQLFPQDGETVPRFRFPEFNNSGEWQETNLKGVCQMQAGKFVSASEILPTKSTDLYPCYGGNGLRGYTKTYTHHGNYSLIGRQGALCGNITYATGIFHATEHAVVVTPLKDICDTEWLYHSLKFSNLNQYATGQAQPGLSVDNLYNVKIVLPNTLEEQKKIARCLSSLDDIIALEIQKVVHLKEHKKGLLQKLFPSIEGDN